MTPQNFKSMTFKEDLLRLFNFVMAFITIFSLVYIVISNYE
jgi:hypothetical protein